MAETGDWRLETDAFGRYLAAKKTVDDRALNRQVWGVMAQKVREIRPLHILEIGAGIGTMAERLVAWDVVGEAVYTAVDALPSNIATAQKRLQSLPLQLELEAIDLFDFVAREQGQRQWDLLIAHAFLDLMDMPRTLPQLFSLLRPGGYFYFSLNFDGATILQPTIDPPFDALVEQLYHRTMDERMTDGRPSGDSQSGRHLFGHLRQAGAEILAAGSSDWVLFGRDGRYPADEAYFLHFIVETMRGALADRAALDNGRFLNWIAQRHAQIEAGELIYIAHQLDFFGRYSSG
jgi:SAM-dependent methyltransferase